ncbi:putative DNA-binding domain-containing protein [Undibacterium sp. SXout20W]|uniref:HvfC/BufC family peptide modification chaperone n=1 Tax=Undibacterium sp. SXout20W TaxID=3413051 RepID=UPI003BF07170
MKKKLELDQLQQIFSSALLEPHSSELLFSNLLPSPRLAERFSFYRGNLSGIWYAALRNAYPVLLQLVGEAFFEGMAKAYGHAHPSQSGDLNQFGEYLGQFLESSDVDADYPYFADVARLEWQLHRAYYAADADQLSLKAALVAVEQSGLDMASACLIPHPAVSLYQSNSSSVEIWLSHQQTEAPVFPDELKKENFGLISRSHWQASVVLLSKAEFVGLQALFQGVTLGDALELAMNEDTTFDVGNALQHWFSVGTFTQINFCEQV